MGDIGLTLRMAVASTILAGVYALLGLVLFGIGGVWAAIIGLPLLVATQYIATVQIPLWREETSEITRDSHPVIYERAEELADELDIEMPSIYLAKVGYMNAFALGRRGSGKVFLSEKLVRRLSLNEIEPVIAHEFAHLQNRDSILMKLGTSIVSVVSSVLFVFFLLASLDSDHPWLVRVVGLFVSACVHFFLLIFVRVMSRYREYVADEIAVRTTGQYEGMESALTKFSNERQQTEGTNRSATRSAISFVGSFDGPMRTLLATHPSGDSRISRIRNLKSEDERVEEADRSRSTEPIATSSERTVEDLQEGFSDHDLLNALQSMDEYAFEYFVADLWSELGWQTEVTTASADKGVDVIAYRNSPFPQKQIIQAKRYSPDNPVSSSEVQQYAGLHLQEDDVDAVVVVSTSRFTSNAQEVAADTNVKLIDSEDICEIIRRIDFDLSSGSYLSE